MFLTSHDDTRIYYELHNPDAAGTPLLLTHGFRATSAMWDANVAALSADRPVLTYDQRGHGQSDAPATVEGYSEERNVGDIAALANLLGDRVIIGGMSLGGYLSMAYHLAHPDRVAALLLQDTGPGYKSDAAREKWNERVEQLAQEAESGDVGAQNGSVEVRRAVHRDPSAIARVARGVLRQRDARVIEHLPTIAVPTLVVVGADDVNYLSGTDYLASRIPGARKEVIADAGHAASIDQPERFNAVVTDWLTTL